MQYYYLNENSVDFVSTSHSERLLRGTKQTRSESEANPRSSEGVRVDIEV